jgi:hypothetical protein
MKFLASVFIAGIIFSTTITRAENLCPWINKATAFGVLGTAEDAATASVSEISSTACSFVYRDGNIARELRVTVEQTNDWERALNTSKAQCGHDVNQLRAIGNEAVMCAANQKGQVELVIGRVRDNVFTISISTSARNDSSMSREALVQRAGLVAEQVSGNLF